MCLCIRSRCSTAVFECCIKSLQVIEHMPVLLCRMQKISAHAFTRGMCYDVLLVVGWLVGCWCMYVALLMMLVALCVLAVFVVFVGLRSMEQCSCCVQLCAWSFLVGF